MLGWSMNLFRIRGIQLSIHASFLLLLAYVAWEGWSEAAWTGAIWSVSYLFALFACVTLHELGHAAAAQHYGVKVPRILLMPIGGMAEMESIPRRPREEIIVALAGPAVNYVIIGLLMIFVRFPANWPPANFNFTTDEFFRHLVLGNLVMGVLNLLPAFPMDGGRVFRALLVTRMPYVRATKIAVTVGEIIAVSCAGFLAYNQNYLGAALFLFIIFAGELELRSVLLMEQAVSDWRELVARFYRTAITPPEADIPPRII
jgi:Zn-dependent protease